MGLQSWAILLLITELLPIKSILNPHSLQVLYLFSFSSVPSSSPLANVASQSHENDTILNFTHPTQGENRIAALPHLLVTKEDENSS